MCTWDCNYLIIDFFELIISDFLNLQFHEAKSISKVLSIPNNNFHTILWKFALFCSNFFHKNLAILSAELAVQNNAHVLCASCRGVRDLLEKKTCMMHAAYIQCIQIVVVDFHLLSWSPIVYCAGKIWKYRTKMGKKRRGVFRVKKRTKYGEIRQVGIPGRCIFVKLWLNIVQKSLLLSL